MTVAEGHVRLAERPSTLPECLHHGAPECHMERDEGAPAGWSAVRYACGCYWRWDRQVGAYGFFRAWP